MSSRSRFQTAADDALGSCALVDALELAVLLDAHAEARMPQLHVARIGVGGHRIVGVSEAFEGARADDEPPRDLERGFVVARLAHLRGPRADGHERQEGATYTDAVPAFDDSARRPTDLQGDAVADAAPRHADRGAPLHHGAHACPPGELASRRPGCLQQHRSPVVLGQHEPAGQHERASHVDERWPAEGARLRRRDDHQRQGAHRFEDARRAEADRGAGRHGVHQAAGARRQVARQGADRDVVLREGVELGERLFAEVLERQGDDQPRGARLGIREQDVGTAVALAEAHAHGPHVEHDEVARAEHAEPHDTGLGHHDVGGVDRDLPAAEAHLTRRDSEDAGARLGRPALAPTAPRRHPAPPLRTCRLPPDCGRRFDHRP